MARSGQGADARRGPSLWKAVPGRRRGRGPLMLRSPRFYARVAVAAIALASLRQVG
jgi:hypothetical protein